MLQQAQRRRLDLAMSWINLGEVYYLLAKRHGGAHADQFLSDLALTPASARRAGRAYDDWCGAVEKPVPNFVRRRFCRGDG